MIKALNHLTNRDKQALAVFVGLAILCSFYFASGILVTYVSQPADAMDVAKDGKGFTVRVLGLQTRALAEQLRAKLQDQYRVPAIIETAPTGQGYLVKIGPLAKISDAEILQNDLRNSQHSIVRIVQNCGPGIGDCVQSQQSHTNTASTPAYDQGKP